VGQQQNGKIKRKRKSTIKTEVNRGSRTNKSRGFPCSRNVELEIFVHQKGTHTLAGHSHLDADTCRALIMCVAKSIFQILSVSFSSNENNERQRHVSFAVGQIMWCSASLLVPFSFSKKQPEPKDKQHIWAEKKLTYVDAFFCLCVLSN